MEKGVPSGKEENYVAPSDLFKSKDTSNRVLQYMNDDSLFERTESGSVGLEENSVPQAGYGLEGGTPVKPFFVKNISGEFGIPTPDRTSSKAKEMMSKDISDRLSDMMRYCVEANYGDWSFGGSLKVCAKTGTAEVSDTGEDAHAWVTGFSLDEDCPFAFSVIVEHGNSGYRAAVPVAAAILEAAANSVRS